MSFAFEFKKPFKEQVDFFLGKVNIAVKDWLDIQAAYNDYAFYVTGAMQADLVSDLRDAVQTAITDGKDIRWFKEQFDKIVSDHGWGATNPKFNDPGYRDWRARIIYQTNSAVSFSAGRYAQLTDPSLFNDRNVWVYRHSDFVAHPRPLHVSWNYVVKPVGDPWMLAHWGPKGFGCRCYVVVTSRETAQSIRYKWSEPLGEGKTYQYTNRKTGEVSTLPLGVDPGWNYTPGQTARERGQSLAATKRAEWPPEIARAFDALLRTKGLPA